MRHETAIAFPQDDFAFRDVVHSFPFDGKHIAGPDRGEHAYSQGRDPNPPVLAEHIGSQNLLAMVARRLKSRHEAQLESGLLGLEVKSTRVIPRLL